MSGPKLFKKFEKFKIPISDYDTEWSILLKLSLRIGIPEKYLVLTSSVNVYDLFTKKSDLEVTTLYSLVRNDMKNGLSLGSMIRNYNHVPESDISMIYILNKDVLDPEIDILRELNSFYSNTGCCRTLTSDIDMDLAFRAWKQSNERRINFQKSSLREILKSQEFLSSLPYTPFTSLTLTTLNITGRVVWADDKDGELTKQFENRLKGRIKGFKVPSGEAFGREDCFDVFNGSLPTERIPYVSFIDETKEIFKIFFEKDKVFSEGNEGIEYSNILPKSLSYPELFGEEFSQDIDRVGSGPYIQFVMWTGEGKIKLNSAKNLFINCVVDFGLSKISIRNLDFTNMNMEDIIFNIERTFPLMSMIDLRINKIGGYCYYIDSSINPEIFFHLVTFNGAFSNSIYAGETILPQLLKSRDDYYFRGIISGIDTIPESEGTVISPSVGRFSMSNMNGKGVFRFSKEGRESFSAIFPGQNSKTLTDKKIIKDKLVYDVVTEKITSRKYIKFSIVNCKNINSAKLMILTMSKLFSYYKQVSSSSLSILKRILPDVKFPEESFEEQEQEEEREISEKKIIKLKSKYPKIFVDNYPRRCQSDQQPTIISSPESSKVKNQVLPFPKQVDTKKGEIPEPLLEDENSFLFICENPDFPYPGVILNKLQNKEDYPTLPCCFRENQFDLKSRNKVTSNYYSGLVLEDEVIQDMGKSYVIQNMKAITSERLGALPKDVENFFINLNITSPERIFRRIGVPITNRSFLHSVLRAIQDKKYMRLEKLSERLNYVNELLEEIKESDKWNDSLISQELYDKSIIQYREALNEELDSFIIYRIFEELFSINIYIVNVTESFSRLEIPRNNMFHIRPHVKRECIILIKHKGISADNLQFDHYEVMSHGTDENFRYTDSKTLFDESASEKLWSSFQESQNCRIYTFVRGDKNSNNSLVELFDPYSKFDPRVFSEGEFQILSQFIDNRGKGRGLNIKFKNTLMTIFTIPFQPLNVPSGKKIFTTTKDNMIEIFGNPSEETPDGFWFPYSDWSRGFYIVSNMGGRNGSASSPISFSRVENRDKHSSISVLKRNASLILQMVRWVFLYSGLNPEEFAKKYFIIGGSKTYDLTSVPRIFPEITKSSSIIRYLEYSVPDLVAGKKFKLYDNKLFEGLVYFLKMYSRENKLSQERKEFEGSVKDGIMLNDLKKDFNVSQLNSKDELLRWVNIEKSLKNSLVSEHLKREDFLRNDVIIFRSKNMNQSFIIQTNYENSLEKAYDISSLWLNKKINDSSLTNECKYNIEDYATVLYSLSPNGDIKVSKVRRSEKKFFIEAIEYERSRYASVLPI